MSPARLELARKTALGYLFFQLTAANRIKIQAEINAHASREALRVSEKKAAKFEALANRQGKVVDSLKVACQQTLRKSK